MAGWCVRTVLARRPLGQVGWEVFHGNPLPGVLYRQSDMLPTERMDWDRRRSEGLRGSLLGTQWKPLSSWGSAAGRVAEGRGAC